VYICAAHRVRAQLAEEGLRYAEEGVVEVRRGAR
jgi:hypothetical protein